MIPLLLLFLLLAPSASATVQPGVVTSVPTGYVMSNLDPNLNSASNNQIYDPNFLPGFNAGLTNTSVTWNTGNGFADLGYTIGPWAGQESAGIPHFAVGPQCCNFVEIPHTQQYRRVEWGDYYYVKAGLASPGVNVENYTTDFSRPADVGLRTDWDWKVQVSMNWKPPIMMNPSNQWGAIGISVTQYVPAVSGNLVSTLINFWMDDNGSKYVPLEPDASNPQVGSNVVTYHPLQVTEKGNITLTLDISPFLQDTLNALGVHTDQNQPPVISYVYLNMEGYNIAWAGTLWSFNVMSRQAQTLSLGLVEPLTLAFIGVLIVAPILFVFMRKFQSSHK